MTFIEELEAFGVKVLKGYGKGEIKICCPFCVDNGESIDTKFRLGINTITGLGHCFNCNYVTHSAVKNTLQKLNLSTHVDSAEDGTEEEEEVIVELPEGFEKLKPSKDSQVWYHKRALAYLAKREVPDWQIEAKVLGVTIVGTYSFRIIFPVVRNKQLVGIVGRDFTDQVKPKYLNSPGSKHLYNCPAKKDITTLVLSEGILKALKIERVCMQASAALLGHSLSTLQIKQLKEYESLKTITVWPDPDRIGLKGAIDVCNKLVDEGYRVLTISPIPNKQADELSDKEVDALLETSVIYNQQRMKARMAFL